MILKGEKCCDAKSDKLKRSTFLCLRFIEGYHMFDSAGFVFTDIFCLHTEKLYNSTGRELRRALFSLKQIFQVCNSLFHLVPDSLKQSAKEAAADVVLERAQSSRLRIVLLKRAQAAETLPSWQLCSVQVQSHITHTHTHAHIWAGLVWWAAGHRKRGLTHC